MKPPVSSTRTLLLNTIMYTTYCFMNQLTAHIPLNLLYSF